MANAGNQVPFHPFTARPRECRGLKGEGWSKFRQTRLRRTNSSEWQRRGEGGTTSNAAFWLERFALIHRTVFLATALFFLHEGWLAGHTQAGKDRGIAEDDEEEEGGGTATAE